MQVTVWPRGSKRVYEATSADANTHISDMGELLSVEFSTRMERTQNGAFGGHDVASWRVRDFGGLVGGLFRPGDHVRVTTNGGVAWEGEYIETIPQGDEEYEMAARGYAYNLNEYDSVYFHSIDEAPDESHPTNQLIGDKWPTIDTGEMFGLEYALNSLGLPIAQFVGTVPTGAYTGQEASEKPIKLNPVLSGLIDDAGKRWAVWGRTLVIDEDPTDPMWEYAAPEAVVGMGDTDYRTRVGVWITFTWEGEPVDQVVWATDAEGLKRFDEWTEVVDYRAVAGMTDISAAAKALELLNLVKGRFLYTGQITVGPDSGLSTPTGGRVPLTVPRAGQMLRIPGMRTGQGNLMPEGTNQFIIGRTEYRWSLDGEESLTITPQGAAPRDIPSLLAPPGGPGDQLQAQTPAA